MNSRFSSYLGILLLVSIGACTNSYPDIQGFDLSAWNNDTSACFIHRKKMASVIHAQKDKLIGLREENIVQWLGKPTTTHLDNRMRKTIFYTLSSRSTCTDSIQETTPVSLAFEFESLGRLRLVGFRSTN